MTSSTGRNADADAGEAPHVVIRRRTEADVARLLDILMAQQPQSRYPYRNPLPFDTRDFIVRTSELAAWVAEFDGQLVGHVSLLTCHDPISGDSAPVAQWAAAHRAPREQLAEIGTLFTAGTHRGYGTGRRLLVHATAELHRRNLRGCIEVLHHNEDALVMYLRHGWKIVGVNHPSWLPDHEWPLVCLVLPHTPTS